MDITCIFFGKYINNNFVELRQLKVVAESEVNENSDEETVREFVEKTRALLNNQLELMGRQLALGVEARDKLEVLLQIRTTEELGK